MYSDGGGGSGGGAGFAYAGGHYGWVKYTQYWYSYLPENEGKKITYTFGERDYYKFEWVEGSRKPAANGGVDGISGAAINHGMANMTATFDRQLAETYYWFKYLAIGKTTTQKMDIMLTYMSTGAPYDFKNRPSSPFHRDNMGEFGLYRGQKMAPDDFGNYNYGFAANALGLPEWFSVAIVGAFPNSVRTWWNVLGGFDQIEDSRMIRAGYNHEW